MSPSPFAQDNAGALQNCPDRIRLLTFLNFLGAPVCQLLVRNFNKTDCIILQYCQNITIVHGTPLLMAKVMHL